MAYYRTQSQGGSSQNVKVGTVTAPSTVQNISITLGFKPKQLCVWYSTSAVLEYDERRSTTKYMRCNSTPSFEDRTIKVENVGNTLQSIDANGFTMRSSVNRTWNYFAIG